VGRQIIHDHDVAGGQLLQKVWPDMGSVNFGLRPG
jgi:hypothetical protein